MKKDVSFVEVYGKVNYTINDSWAVGVNEYYSPNFLNSGAWGDYLAEAGRRDLLVAMENRILRPTAFSPARYSSAS